MYIPALMGWWWAKVSVNFALKKVSSFILDLLFLNFIFIKNLATATAKGSKLLKSLDTLAQDQDVNVFGLVGKKLNEAGLSL